jgi:hypothetical protein
MERDRKKKVAGAGNTGCHAKQNGSTFYTGGDEVQHELCDRITFSVTILTSSVTCNTFRFSKLYPSSQLTLVKMPVTHVLFESASGYAIFEAKITEDIGSKSKAVGASFQDLAKLGKMVSLMSFSPFKSAAQALENINDISEGA